MKTKWLPSRRVVTILFIGIIGFAVGLACRDLVSLMFPDQGWQELPSAPVTIVTFVGVFDGTVVARATDDSVWRCRRYSEECWSPGNLNPADDLGYPTRMIQPCHFASLEFVFPVNPPKNATACIQGITQYPETQGRETYVLDEAGKIWVWDSLISTPAYANVAPFCCPLIAIMAGIAAWTVAQRRKR